MKFFAKYVSSFDVLVVMFDSKPVTKTKKINNLELIYHQQQLIGANIFAPEIDKNKNYGLENKELFTYIIKVLEKHEKLTSLANQFVIVEVIKCEKIEGTHLSLCEVFDGKNKLQIVCGADNVRLGIFTCLATVGAFLPNGVMIGKGNLKGFDSFGMLCSAKELGVINSKYNQQGIIDLVVSQKQIGDSIWQVLK